ncbi:Uncharacterized protein PCOAH_00037380 [Plasmodium coatneyi]|uniref:Uncharacterized protein n=1 Tax=Plasmodium coatneyi TaxID=208452 RepID=A0A1B1E419_9APIC|nr:Uncharacterized protein PCOAH_00037380 [Plasmodium coatneyi]ANQ09774.1 Uncharacterized protein PCOAH_00037380 [Plasmodium coatneyi]
MPVATRKNNKGRKGGVFRFCTKASVYTLLVWIVNCSNSSQYGGNSYSVMNNSLGKAVDSRTLRLLAEAYEEDIEQDGPAVYEEDIEQDGPAVYEEDIEQDGPVVYDEEAIEQVAQEVEQASENVGEISGEVAEEEQVVQKAPSVSSLEEQVVQKAPSLSSLEEQVVQKAPSVSSVQEQVTQKAPSLSSLEEEVAQDVAEPIVDDEEEIKIEYNQDGTIRVRPAYIYNQAKLNDIYEQQRLNMYKRKRPTITEGENEDLIKNSYLFNRRERAMQGDPETIAEYPKGYWDPYFALQKALNELIQKRNEYREMLTDNFYDVKLIDDFENAVRPKGPYIQREYGRPDLRPAAPRSTTTKAQEEDNYANEKGQNLKGKKKRRKRFFCCF